MTRRATRPRVRRTLPGLRPPPRERPGRRRPTGRSTPRRCGQPSSLRVPALVPPPNEPPHQNHPAGRPVCRSKPIRCGASGSLNLRRSSEQSYRDSAARAANVERLARLFDRSVRGCVPQKGLLPDRHPVSVVSRRALPARRPDRYDRVPWRQTDEHGNRRLPAQHRVARQFLCSAGRARRVAGQPRGGHANHDPGDRQTARCRHDLAVRRC